MSDHAEPKHLRDRLLKAVGLQPPPIDDDGWVRLEADGVDEDQHSRSAEAAISTLAEAGIEARQRPFVRPDQANSFGGSRGYWGPGPDAQSRLRVEVLVHQRDLERARQIVAESRRVEPIDEAELTRLAIEAGKPKP